MVTLETQHGRFEAETVKAAEKLAKKAAREAEKRDAAQYELRKVANVRAEAQAFRLVRMKASENGIPRGWALRPAGTPHGTVTVRRGGDETYGDDVLTIETEDGRGELHITRHSFVGHVENNAGWAIAVVLLCDGLERVYAVGTHEGQAAAEYMRDMVTVMDFPGRRLADASAN